MITKSFWENRNVFVTGCTGFLGGWVMKELNAMGANTVGLIRDVSSSKKDLLIGDTAPEHAVFGRLEDYDTIVRAINEYEVDTVFHLGAQPIVGVANRNPVSTFEANIKGTWNVLEACRQVNTVKRVLVASSDKAYGEQPVLPYDESMPLQGMHPYDVSKSCTDLISQTYHNTYKTPVTITRCGNFFGGGDLNFNRIVPGTIRSVLHDENPIIRSDGTFIRDYVYVKDIVNFYLILAEAMENDEIHGHAFNYSAELQLNPLQITEQILKIAGKTHLEPVILNEAKGEIPHQYLSNSKAKEVLGWSPSYTLEQALTETVEWYKQYFQQQG
ncbi:CDP-glucose 4,6-dehydratase [Marisediminitalea aggregata]|jgi:CDP-glucose 4,6-dehydratase|uniref:CDP-glucose 4,6-dehydratase n=1 Tax=Marisediminitalea aggregata TaxID=634436 RepID=A0A1M5R696_9ALTE|nr:GDP-mannose 4,6-dehydratase [Marisediminitalea aggregata]MAP22116.1 sugar dehydratase [Alteromonadaceae bacterium]MEC7826640.1 GDP-mannose 4,6-dehydratase [Pseudomonadota bacterium]HBY41831.1 sugar dehydratase [Alteromonas sp.]MAX41474.1 sugar dehydratase [Alteromonadaceae bacterium]SHH21550.1 CDP-glucose 4,6-dehydratase [Marisediminitalea aggregata]|tara:strand:- start:33340 stop:34326 length:987 start_codon:yes stop_codon:yes gene_type:complete